MQCRFAPSYVLDNMEWYEVAAALNYIHYSHMTEWEQTRTVAYVTAQVNSTKKIKPEEVIKFPWDDKMTQEQKETMTAITKEDIERLNNMAQAYITTTKKNAKH